jgi:Protein of unknown function (DUF2388).
MKNVITIAVLLLASSISCAEEKLGSVTTVAPWTTYTYTPEGTTSGSYSNTKFSGMGVDEMKVVLEAQEDAHVFIASEGEILTARLQEAVQIVRQNLSSQDNVVDVEIVQWIAGL